MLLLSLNTNLLCCHKIFLSLRCFPSINLPASCLSMKSATHVPWKGWWMPPLFFFCLIQVFLKPSSSIHVPCCRTVSEDCFYYCSERNNVVVLLRTLKVQSCILTEVSHCGLLIVITSSTFLKRKDMLKEKSS